MSEFKKFPMSSLRDLLSPQLSTQPARREVYAVCYEVECQFRPAEGEDGTAIARAQMLAAERGEAGE